MTPRSRRGFILFETIVALALLSLCVVAINQALRQSMLNEVMAQDYTRAQILMRGKMAEFEVMHELQETMGSKTFPEPDERFRCLWSVRRISVAPPAFPRDTKPEEREALMRQFKGYMGGVFVKVEWERGGQSYSITGETLVAPGILWQPPKKDFP